MYIKRDRGRESTLERCKIKKKKRKKCNRKKSRRLNKIVSDTVGLVSSLFRESNESIVYGDSLETLDDGFRRRAIKGGLHYRTEATAEYDEEYSFHSRRNAISGRIYESGIVDPSMYAFGNVSRTPQSETRPT